MIWSSAHCFAKSGSFTGPLPGAPPVSYEYVCVVHGAALAAGAPSTMNSAAMAMTTAVILFTFKPFLPLGAPKRVAQSPCYKKLYPGRRATMRDNGRVFTTCSAVAQPRRAVATASSMFPSPRTEWESVLQTISRPAASASRT